MTTASSPPGTLQPRTSTAETSSAVSEQPPGKSAGDELDVLQAALAVRLAAPDHAGPSQAAIDAARADAETERDLNAELRRELEAVRTRIEAARIAASAHGNAAQQARAALRAERLAGATLHHLVAEAEQRIAAIEREVAGDPDPDGVRLETLERDRRDIERAWSDAEARLERANRAWSLEVERIRQSVAAAQAQAVARCGHLLDARAPSTPQDSQRSEAAETALQPGPWPGSCARVVEVTRGANRRPFSEQVEVQIDGEAALLVDLSLRGAQVVSTRSLKPNRAVRILLPLAEKAILCRGQVVWARLEPAAAPGSLRYRAGILFTTVDQSAIEAFLTRQSSRREGP